MRAFSRKRRWNLNLSISRNKIEISFNDFELFLGLQTYRTIYLTIGKVFKKLMQQLVHIFSISVKWFNPVLNWTYSLDNRSLDQDKSGSQFVYELKCIKSWEFPTLSKIILCLERPGRIHKGRGPYFRNTAWVYGVR